MAINPVLKSRLMGSIESDTLVFLCGAGLSMASPSLLPSAKSVANTCYDAWSFVETLDPGLRDNVDQLADYFYSRGDFANVFINRLVPWNKLVGTPNAGHAAIGDLLVCRAAHAALSANFDPLVENWAADKKVAMRGALDGVEANNYRTTSSPLIKFHGCMQRGREETVWTAAQLAEPTIEHRKRTCSEWMTINLPGKHLVVVGFWSDWGYLNGVLAEAFTITSAASVTVVDPSTEASLEAKAPELWAKLHGLSHAFEHVAISGDVFLGELQQAFSEVWLRKFVSRGKRLLPAAAPSSAPIALAAATGPPAPPLSLADLYDIRRDAEAVPYTSAATSKEPPLSTGEAAALRLRLIEQGATTNHSWLQYGGSLVRIVNGAGRSLEDVRGDYNEPPTLPQADVIVCAGSTSLGVPKKLISKGSTSGIVRRMPGSGSIWMTTSEAEVEFAL